jgi:ribosomal protein S18 acetylase RimI-like enzyme
MTITIRPARPDDRDEITRLHVTLSQSTYAHILPATFLADVMPGEKVALWSERLATAPDPEKLSIMVAEEPGAGRLAGFACFVFDAEDQWGAYLHNLYVSADYQGQGLARRLLQAALATFPPTFAHGPLSLCALEDNKPARRLYDRLGGVVSERDLTDGSGHPPVGFVRYTWPNRQALAAALGR